MSRSGTFSLIFSLTIITFNNHLWESISISYSAGSPSRCSTQVCSGINAFDLIPSNCFCPLTDEKKPPLWQTRIIKEKRRNMCDHSCVLLHYYDVITGAKGSVQWVHETFLSRYNQYHFKVDFIYVTLMSAHLLPSHPVWFEGFYVFISPVICLILSTSPGCSRSTWHHSILHRSLDPVIFTSSQPRKQVAQVLISYTNLLPWLVMCTQ